MSQSIVLNESDSVGITVEMPKEEATLLRSTGLVDVRPAWGGGWTITTAGRVGVAQVGRHQVRVDPKPSVGLRQLVFLLSYAANPGFRPEQVDGREVDGLWPVIAETFARLAEAATDRGVLHGYREVNDSGSMLRGRIRMTDQIRRRHGLFVPLEVTYDEFGIDIPENRILRAAIRRLLWEPSVTSRLRRRLSHVEARLSSASILHPGSSLPTWRPSKLNASYVSALHLAEVILGNSSVDPGDGHLRVAAFVVDMARVFEDFVGTALKESLKRYPGSTYLQKKYPLLHGHGPDSMIVPIKPDVVHHVNGRPVLVFDAKYKAAVSNDKYPNADHYQMLAYCTGLALSEGWLVYADGGGERRLRIRNSTIDLIQCPLDLGQEPRHLLRAVDRLADAAWARAARRTAPAV